LAAEREKGGLTQHATPPYTPPHAALHTTPPAISTPQTLPTLHAFLRPRFLQKDSRRRVRQNPWEKEKVHRFPSYSSTCNSTPSTIAPTPIPVFLYPCAASTTSPLSYIVSMCCMPLAKRPHRPMPSIGPCGVFTNVLHHMRGVGVSSGVAHGL
jgi:hypothetical protein